MRQLDISFESARRAAQEGMERAEQGAENKVPKWGELAYHWLVEYARRTERFTGWMVVKAASNDPNFPRPDNEKAWGGPIQRAARRGVIVRAGTQKDPYRHGNPIPLWRSTIYGRAA